MKIDYCYHTHTKRCGHAIGEDEEYVLSALRFGLKHLGFSDHVILPDIIQHGMRGDPDMLEGYIKSINSLKEKYKDYIDISVGFECEYIPKYVPYYKKLLEEKKVNYLILGQHLTFDTNNNIKWYFEYPSKFIAIKKYTDDLIVGIKSGLFAYVAHPDFLMLLTDEWDSYTEECSKRIIQAAVDYNIPLELNLGHARVKGKIMYKNVGYRYEYPFLEFWYLVSKSKAKVVVGFDSHCPDHVQFPQINVVDELIKATGIKPISNYRLKKREDK